MEFDLFLWPMIIPIIIPLLYCLRYKKESVAEVLIIFFAMILMVIFYFPIASLFNTPANILEKFLLFFIIPIILLQFSKQRKSYLDFSQFGIKKEGLKKSILFCIFFLPIMLVVTFVVQYVNGVSWQANILVGAVSFFESFTEEFFFRGVLFVFLLSRTNLWVAYVTSFLCFVLMHPHHIQSLVFVGNIFIISTIVQGILTIEIVRRSGNITGAWLLHGVNRFFSIAIVPLLIFG